MKRETAGYKGNGNKTIAQKKKFARSSLRLVGDRGRGGGGGGLKRNSNHQSIRHLWGVLLVPLFGGEGMEECGEWRGGGGEKKAGDKFSSFHEYSSTTTVAEKSTGTENVTEHWGGRGKTDWNAEDVFARSQ